MPVDISWDVRSYLLIDSRPCPASRRALSSRIIFPRGSLAQGGKVLFGQAAIMKAGGDERAVDPGLCQHRQITGIANAAGRVDEPAGAGSGADGLEPIEVGPRRSADARQRHDNDPRWPQARIGEQDRGAHKLIVAEVEGERDARIAGKFPDQAEIALALTADHQPAERPG